MSYDGVRRRFANLPFNKRTDIVTVYWQLQNAFSRIRTRIDTEFGSKEWKDIDPPIQSFPECDEKKYRKKYYKQTGCIFWNTK